MAAAAGDDSSNHADEQQQHIQKLLQEAGIEDASLMDPASLEALKDYVIHISNKKEEELAAAAASSSLPETLPAAEEENYENEEENARPPLYQVERAGLASHRTLKRFLSDLTDPAVNVSNSVVAGGEYDTTATTAGSVVSAPQQDRMMKLMEHQAQLLLALYERVEELHDKVDAIHKQETEWEEEDDFFVSGTRSPQQQQPHNATGTSRRTTAATRTTSTASSTTQVASPPPPLGLRRRRRAAVEPTNELHALDHEEDEPAHHRRRLHHRNVGAGAGGGNHAVRAHPPAPNLWTALFTLLGHVLTLRFLGLDRFYKLAKLFLELRRRQVPNFDVGLLFKVLVMMAILMARMSSSMPGGSNKNGMKTMNNNNKNDDDAMLSPTELMWIYRFYFLTTIVVVGFIIQSGYATFLYKFFVKHNYPWRVLWDGQDIDVEQAVREAAAQEEAAAAARVQAAAAAAPHPRHLPPGRQPPPIAGGNENDAVAAAPANDQPGWRQAILAGQIPRAAPEHFGNGPLAMVLETLVLIGSFFLSILPMWTPHAPPPPPPPQQPEEDEAQEPNPPARDNPDHREIPQVRPPADPTEYEEDDE